MKDIGIKVQQAFVLTYIYYRNIKPHILVKINELLQILLQS